MDFQSKRRKALRTTFTKNVNKFYEVYLQNIEEANVLFEVLSETLNELKELDQEILNGMFADKTEEEITTEVDKQYEYRKTFAMVKRKLQSITKNDDDINSINSSMNSKNSLVLKSNVMKLPKVELIKFGGDPKDWLGFWSTFQTIDKDNSLSLEEKFQYLMQTMVANSRAYEVVKSFPPTADNYPKVLEELKSRFGRDGLLVQVYVRELLSLVLKNSEVGPNISLTQFYDKLECQLRALESLGVTTENCACILLPLVESCLSEDLLRTWQRHITSHSETAQHMEEGTSLEEHTLKMLRKFIKSEVESEERITLAKNGYHTVKEVKSKSRPNVLKVDMPTASCLVDKVKDPPQCIFCHGAHRSIHCFKAKDLDLTEKRKIVLEKRLCFACLREGHSAKHCKRPIKCSNCFRKHPTIMCYKKDDSSGNIVRKSISDDGKKGEVNNLSNLLQPSQVYLQTLVVNLIHNGMERKVRCLIDTGSMRSYVLESTANEMKLQPEGEQTLTHSLFGNVKTESCIHKEYSIVVGRLGGEYKCRFKVLDQKVISDNIPSIQSARVVEELQYAGACISDLCKSDLKIEVLIGADIAGKLFTGKRLQCKSGLVALETLVGWTIMGRINEFSQPTFDKSIKSHASIEMFCSGSCDLSSLWKLESIGINDPVETRTSKELHELTLKHFQKSVIQNDEGRYKVCLPWVNDNSLLQTNFEISRRRLQSTVDKTKKLGYFEKYSEVFANWQKEGIIEEVSEKEVAGIKHYLPHRAVMKEGSTTPVRPVFDASSHEKGSPSLNDCLEKGMNMIEKIPALLNRFRLGKFGVISDIKQAFLQIGISENDQRFLAFLWVDQGKIKTFKHCRVVFGLVSSPFLLGAVIHHHLKQSKSKFEDKVDVIDLLNQSFYVDNCVASLNSHLELETFISDATEIMLNGSFVLRGWEYSGQVSECITTKVLGLEWNKKDDILKVSFDTRVNELEKITKREIISIVQKIFDPLGFLSPVTLYPKLLFQRTWKEKLKWDEVIEGSIKDEFMKWYTSLSSLDEIKVPRWLLGSIDVHNMSLHMFCDASKSAYAAVAFLRVENSFGVTLQLIQGKSRVAPMKQVTIPRLELLATVIGVRLYGSIVESSEIFKNMETFFWSDSSTCLAWIKRNENWDTFVKNRVQEVRCVSNPNQWKFVPGNLNPADLPSRGCSAKKLLSLRWWEGPSWLLQTQQDWPSYELNWNEEEINQEKRKTVISSFNKPRHIDDWYYRRFSRYNMIVRCMAWIFRFVNNCRSNVGEKISGPLSGSEITSAEIRVLKTVQEDVFSGANSQSLQSLNYYTDDQGVKRLNTKIALRKDLPYFCQPIILPPKHPVVVRLIREIHEDACHVGVQGLLSKLRERFWILGGRRSVRAVVQRCVICRRHSSKRMEAPIAPLPNERIRDPVAFEICGVDLTGPVYLKGNVKAYVCIFTCAIVRAVHFELIVSLSTEAFIQAFRRFISRRGRPVTMFSDNGTNFLGTENLFKSLDWERIQDVQRINWKFSVPCSPWWGGFYERMIRLLKDLLKRVLRKTCLSYEDMLTSLCEVECVINARPLTYISEDPNDLTPITPSMFIQDLRDSRTPDLDSIENIKFTKKAIYRQKIRDELKLRFRNEYLGQLQLRKNDKKFRNPEVGEVVLIGSDNDRRLNWPMAVVTEVIKGKDGVMRTVKLKTSTGELCRPVQRIYPLEVRNIKEGNDVFIPETERLLSTRSGRKVKIPERFLTSGFVSDFH